MSDIKLKKPDHIVWDEENQKYNANILPYGSSVSAPVIKIEDISSYKQRNVKKIQTKFNKKYQELVDEYNNLVDEVKLNQVVYQSKFSFEPIIGHIYHLYYGNDGKYFLSLIEPEMWNQEFVLSVELNSEHKWVLIKKPQN